MNKKLIRTLSICFSLLILSLFYLYFQHKYHLLPYKFWIVFFIVFMQIFFEKILQSFFMFVFDMLAKFCLIILFYFVFTPIAFIFKITGGKFFPVNFDKNLPTYWEDTTHVFSKEYFKRQF